MNIESLDQTKLSNVSELAKQQLALEERIDKGEKLIKELKEQHRIISEVQLPDAMAALEMKEITLQDGSKISVSAYYGASIPKANQEQAFQWLRDNGHGSLIKHEISCSFGRDQDEEVEALRSILKENSFQFDDDEKVHPQTLKAFVKEQVEENVPIPLDLLGAHIGQKTVIKKKV